MKIISNNRRGLHGFKILEKYEAGISLLGWEVKSARQSSIDLTNSYVFYRKGELFLCNSHFPRYMLLKCDERRERKLLMHKREIERIKAKVDRLGSATILPIKMYFNKWSKIKVEIAIVQGIKKADKREEIKKRESKKYMKKVKSYYNS